MVLEKLGESLKNTLSKIASAVFIDEKLVNELIKDMQKALLQSDVNVGLVLELSQKIKQKVLKEEIPAALTKKEYLINVVYEELTNFLGGEGHKIDASAISAHKPFKIMLVGLFGNGKTTTAGKIGKFFQKRGLKVALLQTDTWRPAAYEQLMQLGAQIKMEVYGNPNAKNPEQIYAEFAPKLAKYDLIIIDTAGRDALNEELITELNNLNNIVQPHESLLVMSADLGQSAQKQAEIFHQTCKITGVIITKMDGTAKGGGALSACTVTNANVKFIGVGEKIDAIEPFYPDRMASRILGMGDVLTLIEKAQEVVDEKKAKELERKLRKDAFTLEDFREQSGQIKKMGSLESILAMVPGFKEMQKKSGVAPDEKELVKTEAIINSMTKKERFNHTILNANRRKRVAKGSGTSVQDVNKLVKQYIQTRELMKRFSKGGLPKIGGRGLLPF